MFWIFALLSVILGGVASVTSYSVWGLALLWVALGLATLFVRLLLGRGEPS
jgi:hypothetical protein